MPWYVLFWKQNIFQYTPDVTENKKAARFLQVCPDSCNPNWFIDTHTNKNWSPNRSVRLLKLSTIPVDSLALFNCNITELYRYLHMTCQLKLIIYITDKKLYKSLVFCMFYPNCQHLRCSLMHLRQSGYVLETQLLPQWMRLQRSSCGRGCRNCLFNISHVSMVSLANIFFFEIN